MNTEHKSLNPELQIYFKKTGEGFPLIILHGLFGLGDNWSTLSKVYAENGFTCYLVDQRNHGRSFHSAVFDYNAMADDLHELMKSENIEQADIIGHSMGGKTAMFFAAAYPQMVRKLIIADIAPRYYQPHHDTILAALKSLDIDSITSRKQAEEELRISIKDEGTIQFLLKNLFWKDDGKLDWRFGLNEIITNIDNVGETLPANIQIDIPTLFIKGEKSGYINDSDQEQIKKQFTNVQLVVIQNAGHWVHAENPKAFLEQTLQFLQ